MKKNCPLNGFLSLCYLFICFFIKANKKLVTFMSFPDISDNSFHLFRSVINLNNDKQICWLVADVAHSKKKLESMGFGSYLKSKKIKVLKKKSILGVFNFIKSGITFHTHGTFSFVKHAHGRKIVNLWHGMPIKKIAYLDKGITHTVNYSDYIIATSTFFSYVMSSAFLIRYENTLITDLPRNVVLVKKNKVVDLQIMRKLGINDSPFCMWLPTYRVSAVGDIRIDSNSSSFISELPFPIEKMNTLLAMYNLMVIIKLHPMDGYDYSSFSDLSHIKIISSDFWNELYIDLYDVLSCSVGLISDLSSVVIDYMLTGNPIACFNTAGKGYTRGVVYDYNFNEYPLYNDIKCNDDFVSFILMCVSLKKTNIVPSIFHSVDGEKIELFDYFNI